MLHTHEDGDDMNINKEKTREGRLKIRKKDVRECCRSAEGSQRSLGVDKGIGREGKIPQYLCNVSSRWI